MVNHAISYANQLIIQLEILLWRFYRCFFHYLGLMRTQYDRSQNTVKLTYYSVTVANMVGLFWAFQLIRMWPINGMQLGFIVFLLVQPRSVFEKRIRLINDFLRISSHLYLRYKRTFQLNTTLPLSLMIKFSFIDNYLTQGSPILILVAGQLMPHNIATSIINITCMLVSSATLLIFKYTTFVNEEITAIGKRLPLAVLRMEHRAVRRMKRRLAYMRTLNVVCSQIIKMIFECLGIQLLFLTYFNINFLASMKFDGDRTVAINVSCGVALHSFLISLGRLATMYSSSHIVDFQVTPIYDEFSSNHNWVQKTFSTWRTEDWSDHTTQDSMHHLLKPRLLVLGLFAPNERFLFYTVFTYGTITYLKLMWGLAALNAGKNK
ncbi:hypothetical protein KR074_009706 [Drosophila pseudoananassae]|nr:hypothetical protein KR074_009706 [Drosophila pseudoananassae]